jgi:hypothetical protein
MIWLSGFIVGYGVALLVTALRTRPPRCLRRFCRWLCPRKRRFERLELRLRKV